jgi:hypothetical protein
MPVEQGAVADSKLLVTPIAELEQLGRYEGPDSFSKLFLEQDSAKAYFLQNQLHVFQHRGEVGGWMRMETAERGRSDKVTRRSGVALRVAEGT